jgi:hypothetical protein
MIMGSLGVWATEETWAFGHRELSGLSQGSIVVVAFALFALLLVRRWPGRAAVCGVVAVCWTVLDIYTLPGSRTDGGAWAAGMTFWPFVAIAGAVWLIRSALWQMVVVRRAQPAQ